jgi:NAD(P)-dependent dehydrogenase (short-subunit alcohol dehydrogenase family)
MARHLPLGMGKPEDIAKGALYLASQDADYVTGTVLTIDGGFGIAQV